MNWRSMWPIPGLALAATLFVAGLVTAVKTAPKPSMERPLSEAESLLAQGEYQGSLDVLNRRALPLIDEGVATLPQRRRFHLLRADAVFAAQESLQLSREENHRNIVRELLKAEEFGAELDEQRTERLVNSLAALGTFREAVERVRGIDPGATDVRAAMIRSLVPRMLASDDPDTALALELARELTRGGGGRVEDRVWGLAREAEALLADGRPEAAASMLMREMQTLPPGHATLEGELHLLLGEAFWRLDRPTSALDAFERAEAMVDRESPLRAAAGVRIGRLRFGGGDLVRARERFETVIGEFSLSAAMGPALLGMGEVAAAEGDFDESLAVYRRAVDGLGTLPASAQFGRAQIGTSLLARAADRFDAGDMERSRLFADLAAEMWGASRPDPDVIMAQARAHRGEAIELLGAASEEGSSRYGVATDPVVAESARQHFEIASERYLAHARSVLEHAADTDGYLDSLWLAADCADRSGDLGRALDLFTLYRDGSGPSEPRRPEAQFRMAQVYQARADFVTAASLYRDLIEAAQGVEPPKGVGQWADRSVVPLARCLLLDSEPENDDEAVARLQRELQSGKLTPESEDYRRALLALGDLYYQTQRYNLAVESFRGYLDRYPDGREAIDVTFKLADSNRLLAAAITATLTEERLPTDERARLGAERAVRLGAARSLYDGFRAATHDEKEPGPLRSLQARNAQFYAADCSFDLGELEDAVARYDRARQAHADDPASLVAMVQIVNAYVRMGRIDDARIMHERARRHFRALADTIPESVWSSPAFPMEPRHWELWLQSRAMLEAQASAP